MNLAPILIDADPGPDADRHLDPDADCFDLLNEGATLDDLDENHRERLREMVRADFQAAVDARTEREERAKDNYRVYKRKVREGHEEIEREGGRGPFGWSKIQVPFAWWIVETMAPRHGTNPPTITVNARSPEAVPFAQAKQMRLQHNLERGDWQRPYQSIIKQKLILGDGFGKVAWDRAIKTSRLIDADWFDVFFSAEATVFEDADWVFHRTSYSRRQLKALMRSVADEPEWNAEALDELIRQGGERSAWDRTFAERKDAADMASTSGVTGTGEDAIPLVEAWASTGEYVVIGGQESATLVRAGLSPFKDETGNRVRPFAFFRGITDIVGPYSQSICEVLEDHQVEMTTIRNQLIDQMTANINSPIAFDETQLQQATVELAMRAPGGLIPIQGDPRTAIMRLNPGQVAGDYPMIAEMIRSEGQMTSGVTDIAGGQLSQSGLENQTATGLSIIAGETNKRIQLSLLLDEMGMKQVAKHYDWQDRQFGVEAHTPVEPGWSPDEGQSGITMVGPGFATIGPEANRNGLEYEIEIDAGSSARPDQMEEAQKQMAMVNALSHPAIGPLIDWREMAQSVIQTFGGSAERLMLPAPPRMPPGAAPVGPDGQPLAPPPPEEPPMPLSGAPLPPAA